MIYRYILTATVLLSGLIFSSTHPLEAQETPALWSHCKRVIEKNTVRLQAIPNLKVTANSKFATLTVPYPDAKANLNRRYIFTLKGSAVSNVLNSPKLMTEITQEITDSCVGTAVVTFGRDRTGEFVNVGLFPNGAVKRFTCGADLDVRTRTRPPMTWGQQACDL
jgi:hypothetical protein